MSCCLESREPRKGIKKCRAAKCGEECTEGKKTQHRIRSLNNGIKRDSFNQMLKCRLTTEEWRIRNSFPFVLLAFFGDDEKLQRYYLSGALCL